jgi:ribonuclease P protein component
MKRRSRLSRSRDFDAVYRHGRSASSRYLVMYSFARNEEDAPTEPRLGLAVSRKVGGAVERNRLKRLLREAFDRVKGDLVAGNDYVLVARPGVAEAADAQGSEWLAAQVLEVASQTGAAGEARRP